MTTHILMSAMYFFRIPSSVCAREERVNSRFRLFLLRCQQVRTIENHVPNNQPRMRGTGSGEIVLRKIIFVKQSLFVQLTIFNSAFLDEVSWFQWLKIQFSNAIFIYFRCAHAKFVSGCSIWDTLFELVDI